MRDQSPEESEYDVGTEWLMVELDARYGDKAWSEADPCLQKEEVERLAEWAEDVAEGREQKPRCSFKEGDLAFEVDRAANQMIVDLDLEMAPVDYMEMDPLRMRLAYDADQLRAFAMALRKQLEDLDHVEPEGEGPMIPPRPPSRPRR